MDIKEIREEVSIFDVAEELGFEVASANDKMTRYYDPRDPGGRAALVAYAETNRMHSYNAPVAPNGAYIASTIDLMMQFGGLGYYDALEQLSNGEYEGIERVQPEQKKTPQRNWLRADDVVRGYFNARRALPYFQSRGLTPEYVKTQRLGMYPNYAMSQDFVLRYGRWAGREIERQPAHRYTLPVFCTKPKWSVKSIGLRLDTEDAQQRIELLDPTLLAAVREHAEARRKVKVEQYQEACRLTSEQFRDAMIAPVESMMLDILFGDKYITWGTQSYVYQWWLFARWDGKRYILPHHEKAMVMEGQFDAGISWLHGRVPAASVGKGRIDLKRLFRNVDYLYIVVDNDDKKWDIFKKAWFSPGARLANQILRMTGRTLGKDAELLHPFPEFKDTSDMHKAGAYMDWLSINGLLKRKGEIA